MGALNDILLEALASARPSDGVELTTIISINLCSGDNRSERKSSKTKSPILRKSRSIKSFLYEHLLPTQRSLLFQMVSFRTS